MTRLISILIILVVIFCGWRFYKYWGRINNQGETEVVGDEVRPENLAGLPSELYESYTRARAGGINTMRSWLKANANLIADPRRAWIELDYCVLIARDNPAEARQLFAEVKQRTPQSSPVWPRIKQLEQSFE